MGETVVYGIKLTLAAAAAVVVGSAIVVGMSLVTNFASNTALGEVAAIVSAFLPFSAKSVFDLWLGVFTAIIALFVAYKVYNLVINTLKAT